MNVFHPRYALATLVTGALLIAIFAATILLFRRELRDEIHQKIIERDAAVLYPIAEARLREAEADPDNQALVSGMLLPTLLTTIEGMRGVAIYDVEGNILQVSPSTLKSVELAPDDFARLVAGAHISRYVPQFPLNAYFTDQHSAGAANGVPMLEVLLPLHAGDSGQLVGYVKYYIDAERLAAELDAIDRRLGRQTFQILALASALILLVLIGAHAGLARAQRIIAERNERLTRANFELTLAAKTSALGVITSHLIHGLQGPVAGLRAMVADHAAGTAPGEPEWKSAATYTERMQAMIHETVTLLGDTSTQTTYELTGAELASTIAARNHAAAAAKGVLLEVGSGFAETLDSHRGSLICLIATNLVQNAIDATDPGRHVRVSLEQTSSAIELTVADEGRGIPADVRAHLFEPGRSGRPGGTGLGLSISQLLARQVAATLELVATGDAGTTFKLTVPHG